MRFDVECDAYYIISKEKIEHQIAWNAAKEIIDIMITLFDQREVMEDFIASEIANEDKRKSISRARTLYKNSQRWGENIWMISLIL